MEVCILVIVKLESGRIGIGIYIILHVYHDLRVTPIQDFEL